MNSRYPFAVIKEKLHARKGEIADFAIGSHKVALGDQLQNWISDNSLLITLPASPADVAKFREAAAEMLHTEYGVSIDFDCIVPVPGGRVGMSAFISCALGPGDDVVTTVPGYPAFARMARHRRASIHEAALNPDMNFAPEFVNLPESVRPSVIALNYPNNPTGETLTPETRKHLVEFASGQNAVLFNDAVYGPLTYDQKPASLLDSDAHVPIVELHSLTKLYPLGPLSGSFLAGSRDLMQEISTYSEFAWAPMSSLQVQSTTICMKDDTGRKAKKEFFAGQLKILRDTLEAIGFQPYPTPSGIYVLCRLPDRIGGQVIGSAQEAAAILLDKYDIAVVPFESGERHYLRFSSLYDDKDLSVLQATASRLRIDD